MAGEKRLFVIGIDEYGHGFHRKLQNAALDAKRFAGILQDKYGFKEATSPLYNKEATMLSIRKSLSDLAASCIEDDVVVVYYAGHGIQHPDSLAGYWVPYDADENAHTYLDHSTVINDLRKIRAKHVLLISDSCYSGTFISQTRGSAMVLNTDELEALDSRWIFVSGDEETVSDGEPGKGSPFSKSLCDFLQQNNKTAVPAWELFDAVSRMTQELTRNTTKQVPQSDSMRFGHKGGQMVFRLAVQEPNANLEFAKPGILFTLPVNPALEFYMPRSLSAVNVDPDSFDRFFEMQVERTYLDELMETQRRLIILGAAGMGKSIELLYRAEKWNVSGEDRRAIFTRFNTYTGQDIEAILPVNWQEVSPTDLYLFFDGLDEIQPVNFHTAVRKLSDFQARHPLIGIIISCRTNFYELPINGFSGTLPGFEVFHLNDINYGEIIKHAQEKYELNGEAFLESVHENGFSDIVQKPFFMRVLLEHYKNTNDLHISRTVIMENALLAGYTGNKEHFYSTGQTLSKAQTFLLLEKIAFVLEVRGKNFLTDEEMVTLFPKPEEYELCRYLPAFSRDEVREQWIYDHNNIQEYLASRVLAKQPLEELIKLISSEIAGERRVKPTWVNTLSFLISTGEKALIGPLLEWLAETDREVIVRFEPDRIDNKQRESLFRSIYDYYRDHGMWLHSNKFTDRELARFGNSIGSLSYLLEQLNGDGSERNNRLNALSVLRHFRIGEFIDKADAIRAAILSLLDHKDLEPQDIYSIMNTLYRLNLNDYATIKAMVERFGQRKNQYIRAGLYNLIQHSNDPDSFVSIYLDGLDITELDAPDDDRGGVMLMDESITLTSGLSGLNSPVAINMVFEKFNTNKYHSYLYLSDYTEVMEKLLKKAISCFFGEDYIYDSILKLFHLESTHHRSKIIHAILEFFNATGTLLRALRDTWENPQLQTYEKGEAFSDLVSFDILKELLNDFAAAGRKEDISEIHGLLVWHTRSDEEKEQLLSLVEQIGKEQAGLELERPVLRDWGAIHRQREQASFDMLFETDQMIAEVNRVFEELGKEKLTRDDLYNYRKTFNELPENRFNNSALLVIGELMHGDKEVSLEIVNEWLSLYDVQIDFRINHIHAKLSNQPNLKITDAQKNMISDWCIANKDAYRKNWYFLQRLKIELPEEQLLELSSHTNFSHETKLKIAGNIEQLAVFVNKEKLSQRVLENLAKPGNDVLSWIMNAGYALRNKLKDGYSLIIDYLQASAEIDYSLDEVLNYWFEQTGDRERLKTLVRDVPAINLRWRGIRLLEELGGEEVFLNEQLTAVMVKDDEDLEDRIFAANHLLRLNDMNALAFLVERITKHPHVPFDFRVNLGTISYLRDVAAIPMLLQLLLLAKQPDFKIDPFNNLESPVLSGLFHIGTHSPGNFLAVKTALLAFMTQYSEVLPNLQYLVFNIANMEDELRKKYSEDISIVEALAEYQRFTGR